MGGTITYADGLYETTANTVNILNNDFNKENLDQFKAGNASDIRMQGASSGADVYKRQHQDHAGNAEN